MSSKGSSGAVALRYANAFVDVAEAAGVTPDVEKDLESLSSIVSVSEDLRMVINSPLIDKSEKMKSISAIASRAKFNKITQNFLMLLVENGRLGAVESMIGAIKSEISKRRGEVEAKVSVASKLTDAQVKDLQKSLSKATGSNVALSVDVDKSLIGGMVVTVGSQIIDDSVKRKLEKLSYAMMNSSNSNVSSENVSKKEGSK